MTKFIFITGGVLSSLGKGLTTSAIAALLECRGMKVAPLKLDPYLNVDPGTMNPFEHGEIYVTDDGSETDLDLGHYFRFTKAPLSKLSSVTSGQVYESVIKKERSGQYLGSTVQVIPHITNEIKDRIFACGKHADVTLVEIGGTVGDIESTPFLEAIRQLRYESSPNTCLNIHMTYVPYFRIAQEIKTKPTQHSTQELRSIGIVPDIILCRCEASLSDSLKEKIALFCSVPKRSVFEVINVDSIYQLPSYLHQQHVDALISEQLNLKDNKQGIAAWNRLAKQIQQTSIPLSIGLVGKYTSCADAYKSVAEALQHAGLHMQRKVILKTFDAKTLNPQNIQQIDGCDGYIIPGGFGEGGFEGKILAARYCRENKLPLLGICLGMQVIAVEFARHVLGLDASSTEMDKTCKEPVIALLEEQKNVEVLGGTMRLGAYPCHLKKGTLIAKIYNQLTIYERHRHRYEFNNKYTTLFEEKGCILSGVYKEKDLCEVLELKDHPWLIGVQYHPEFKSKPLSPHPLFVSFIQAAMRLCRD